MGDSIFEGANSSGVLNIPPYQPTVSALFRQYLEKRFGVEMVYENFSLGGMKSEWGVNRAHAAGQFAPDLVILSFGTNDGGKGKDGSAQPVPVETYIENMQKAIDNVREYNPHCEFIVVSSLMPNPTSGAYGIQEDYAQALPSLAQDDSSVVTVDMYRLHDYLVAEREKHYVDLTSNYINHPNDFLIRLYVMNMISALWN